MSTNAVSKPEQQRALQVIRDQIGAATGARKCHSCGCFHSTVIALDDAALGNDELTRMLAQARATFVEQQYDCRGCPVCYPAVASNALVEGFPEQAGRAESCPVDAPAERGGWPPLPGDYRVHRYRAPVAVCTLNSDELAAQLELTAPDGLSICGTLRTENLGIERIIQNVLANPHIRFLVLCGEDTQQAIGHLPGQSLASLCASGLDERGRIRGARGRRPVLENVSREQVDAFLEQVELVDMIGVDAPTQVRDQIEACAARDPGPFQRPVEQTLVTPIVATSPRRLILDPAGYFVLYPDALRSLLVLEHYRNDGVLDTILEGHSCAALYATAIERGLLTRLDHAAYLGRELARAKRCLETHERYVQDRAPGDVIEVEERGCGCSSSGCGGNR